MINFKDYINHNNNQFINDIDKLINIIEDSAMIEKWKQDIIINDTERDIDHKEYYKGREAAFKDIINNDIEYLVYNLTSNILDNIMKKFGSILFEEYNCTEAFVDGYIYAFNDFYRLLYTDKKSEVLSELEDAKINYKKWLLKQK